MAPRLRHILGTLVYDWPRFLPAVAKGGAAWLRFRNRDEPIAIDPATGGVRCEWVFTHDLHLPTVFPFTGRWLMKRALDSWPIRMSGDRPATDRPAVSFVIGHRGTERIPLLLATVRTIAAQRGAPVECIVVEQSARPTAASQLPDWVRHLHTPIASDSLPYNRAAAFNAGAAIASAPILVLHDNDFLVPERYAAELVARHREGWEFIDLKRFMFYASESQTRRIEASRKIDPFTPERIVQNSPGGGSVAADRDAYFAIGGFDESFVGWGGEDNEFWERALTRRTWTYGYLPFAHLFHTPQQEKTAAVPEGGRRRMLEVENVSAAERIARLVARSGGTE